MYDVARRAGVSIATVSFAFRQPTRVRETTREAVLLAARDLGFVPSGSARELAQGSTGTLGMYSFDLLLAPPESDVEVEDEDDRSMIDANPELYPLYVDEIQNGFVLECRRRGKAVLLGSESQPSSSVIDIAGRVDGLALFPGERLDDMLEQVARRIPLVAFSMDTALPGIQHIRADNRGGAWDIVDHLVGDHHYRDLAFVGSLATFDSTERFLGFKEALHAYGITPPNNPMDPYDITGNPSLSALANVVESGNLPQALVCASDQAAIAVLALLRRFDINVPREVAVTGFDGILAGRLTNPTLTTVRQPMEAMGKLAAHLLTLPVTTDPVPTKVRMFPVRMVIGRSCGCPGA
ncbi:MAG: LacI family transcriptional regulator [Cellulomonadaceae bacterium]|nr:LacI family transcriptional regulator [Cellulomonadaceae bacterium]